MLRGTCHCGAIGWTFDGDPGSATSCNCTLCRRYGGLWIYDFEGGAITLSGPSKVYIRRDNPNPALEMHFCGTCGCVAAWRGLHLQDDGRRRMAVNVRLAEPESVAHLPIDPFDGLVTFEDLPKDGRCVKNLWF